MNATSPSKMYAFLALAFAAGVLQPTALHAQLFIHVIDSSVTVNENGGTYEQRVWLNELPTSDVTVQVVSGDATVATVNPTMLTFTPSNYRFKQTVTYTAVNDAISNDPRRKTTITFTASGGGYDGVSHATTITLADDESLHLVLDEGKRYRFPHRWTVGQGCPAVMSFESSDTSVLTVDPATLTWTEAESGATKYLFVSILENDVRGDGMATISRSVHDPPCTPLDIPDIIITAKDNDHIPTLSVDAIPACGTTVTDASVTPSFALVLTPAPGEEVETEYRWVTDSTTGRWLAAQPIGPGGRSVRTSNNTFAGLRQAYAGFAGFEWRLKYDPDVTALCTWQFESTVTLPTVRLSASPNPVPEGSSVTVTARLSAALANTVTVPLTLTEGTAEPDDYGTLSGITINAGQTSGTGTISTNQDTDEDDETFTVALGSLPSSVTAGSPSEVTVTISDDDGAPPPTETPPTEPTTPAGVTVAPTALTINEGDQDTYTVVLDTQPAANVTVTPTSGDAGAATVAPATLTFAPDNWNQPQTITVTAPHDDDADDERTTITHAVSGYGDVTTADNVQVTVNDDDTAPPPETPPTEPTTPAGVTVAPTALTIAEGDQDTYTVVLDTQPAANVTVTPTSGDAGAATVAPATLMFAPDNWNQPQTITVTAPHDDDADDERTTITHAVSGYGDVTTADNVQVTVNDDDTAPPPETPPTEPTTPAGVTVAPTALTIAEGDQDTYTVVLDTQPAANVTVTPTSGDAGAATVAPATLMFAPDNWNQPQTITVTAPHDDDADDERTTITHAVSGYGDVTTADNVQVTVNDDDTAPPPETPPTEPTTPAGVTVTPTALTIAEGDQDTYTVVLDTQPAANVTVTPASGDAGAATVAPATLTFAPDDWNQPQTITVTAPHDDDADDERTTITHAVSGYGDVTTADNVQVTVNDDDTAGVTVAPTALTIAEGDQSAYTVVLDSRPSTDVTITPTSGAASVATVAPATLMFAPDNWNQPQTITVTAPHDDDADDERTTITHAVSGYGDVTTADNVQVTVNDDDTAGVTVAPTALTIAEGDQDIYTVVLDSRPATNVTVTPTSGDAGAATVASATLMFARLLGIADSTRTGAATVAPATLMFAPNKLMFAPDNWNQPQTITVTAPHDDDADDERTTITHAVSGYGDVTTADNVQVTVNDDDTAGVTVTPTALTIAEGDQDTYTVVLDTQPADNVTVTPTSGDAGAAIVRPTALTFAPDNWNQPQTITVTAPHDDDADDERTTITHAVSGYGDVTTADNVQIAVNDDDTAGVTVTPTALTIAEGDENTYTVVLDSRPAHDVTVTPTSGDAGAATVATATLTFAPDNWNQPQTITVTAPHDDDADDERTTITHAVSGYGDVTTADNVQVTVNDDDTAGVTVTPTALTIAEGDENTYTVVLDSRPAHDVTVTPTSGDAGAATVATATLMFAPDDWNQPQTITVAAPHDDDADDERTTITHAVSGYGDVTTADNVQVAVDDDDTAGVSVAPTALTIAEGDQSTYTVVLDSRPSTDVTITPTSSDASVATVSPAKMTFTPDDWNQPQTITATGIEDDDAYNESILITHAVSGYDDVTTADNVQVSVPDDDTAGVSVAPTALTVNEGDQSTYTVVLDSRPSTDVTITPTSSDASVATVSPAKMTFTPDDWNQPQTITLAAEHDDDAYDASATITHAVSGYDHVTTADEVVVAILDDDTAGVTVEPTELTVAEGDQDAYTVVLDSRPNTDVTITPASGDASVATVSPATLTFAPDNWNQPQTITVATVQDDDAYNERATITHAVSGYDDVTTAAAVQVAVPDDDTPGATIAPTALTVNEGDESAYTVVLNTRPATNVIITPASGDESVATVSPAKMTFTPDNWNQPQTITVTAAHDDDAYDASTTITHDVSGYDRVTTADDVQVSIPDDDTPGVTVAPTTLTINEGDQSAYTVVLDTRPATNVTITPTSGDAGAASVSPEMLTFTTDNWNQPQTITVTVPHDDDAYDASTTIAHDVNGYDHVTTADDVQVSVPDDDTPGATVAPTTLTINEGDQSIYTVVLNTQPANNVTITSTSGDASVATVAPTTLTFTPHDWNQPQTITVAATQDDDAYDASTTITHDVSGYDHVTTADNVQIAVNDDDTPGATVAPTALTINEGDQSTYTVVLDTRPATNVTITPASGDESVATVSPATLTFAPDNWNQPQTITVTAAHDDDAYDESATITHDVSGYDHITTADNVSIAVPDDDTAGVTVAPTALTINEGDQSTYTVVLDTRPATNVTITPASGDESVATVSPATLTFAPDNWNQPQTITVTAAHDDDAYDESATITHDVSGYDHITTADNAQVAVNDDDTPGVAVEPTALTLNEGDQSAYTVVLDSRPAHDVTITPASGDESVATVSPATLTFAPDNWNQPQTITVTAAHDDDAYDESATITHDVSGYDHVTTADNVQVSVNDDDTAGVTVEPTTLTVNEGDQDTYTVVLDSQPNTDVTIIPASGDENIATVSPATLTFAPDNWNQPQTITVTAAHDDDAYDERATITHDVSGYDHVTTADEVVVAIPDDDTPGVTVEPTALTINEGDQDTYTIVLDSRPRTDVTVTPTSGDENIASVSPAKMTFTPHDWNQPQTITVTAAHDDDAYDERATITHSVNGYDHVTTAKTVQIAVPDDDTPGVTVEPTALTINEGDQDTYTIVLDSRPRTDVTITPTSGDENIASVSPAKMTFTPHDWNQPQTITVTAAHDDDAYDERATITHDVNGYDHVTTADEVVVAIPDDDTAGITVAPTALTINEGDQSAYTVVLDTRPADNVTVIPTSGDENIATVAPTTLTFAPDNWNQPQTITVTAIHDDDAYDESTTITHDISGYDHVTTADNVQVSVLDDDTPGVTVAPTALTINEGDQSAYTVVLDTQPAANVTITATSGDENIATVSPAMLTFAPDNWNQPQTITVAATHDDDAYDASTTITHDVSGYDHITTADEVVVAIPDDDTAGVTVEPTALTINEGDQDTYTVVLDTRPAHDVTITPTSGDAGVATVAPTTLTFAPDNWNQPQTITVAATHDDDAYDASTTITHDVSGYDHITTADEVVVAIPDDDTAGITVAPTALTINEGDQSTYTVVLNTRPATNVTITPTSGDASVATVSPATLTFTPDNWNQPQTITVAATHDDDAYDASTTITHDVSGYDHITTADNVQVSVNDDDAAGVTVAPTTLTVAEGDQDTYTVVLNTRPVDNVTVTPASGYENIATVSPATLTFAPDNWNTPQTITVAATHDDDAYDASTTITHDVNGYDHVTTAATVQVSVPDDDTAGVTVEPTELTVAEGAQSAYTVVLDTQPATNVTITSTSGAASVATIRPTALTFTTANWNTPQTITVTATHDDDAYDASTTITHDVSGYDHVTTADNVHVSVADDDTPGVTVAPTTLTVNEGDQDTYTVVLDTRPAHDVTITTTSGNADVASVSPATLTFAPDNWNTPRTVTVATGEDADADDAGTTITHAVNGYDHVTTAATVQVSVADNDLALDPAMLADLARALADQRVGAIVRRIGRARNGGVGAMASRFSLPADWQDLARALKGNAFNVKDMLGGADLTLPLNDSSTRPPFTLWGGTDYRNLSFRGGPAAWNGDLFTIHMGMSGGLSAHWLAGLATAWSQSELFYRGAGDDADYELNLASVHPYANWTRNGWDAWLTAGYGRGELGVGGQSPARRVASDVNTRTAGGGLSAEVLATGATKLRLKGEALRTELMTAGSAEKGAGIAALTVDASRLRMTVEATRPRILTSGARLAPMLEVGVRHDGGDGETGTGAELGGGLSYDDPTRRLTAAGNARVLLGRRGHDEWGFQAEFELRPRQDGGGASFSLRPGYGHSASGVQRLYERGLRGPNPGAAPWTAARLNARLGYGFFASGGVLTLAGEMTTTGGAKSYRLRPHWTPDEQLNVELIGERRKRLGSHATHTILLKGLQRF